MFLLTLLKHQNSILKKVLESSVPNFDQAWYEQDYGLCNKIRVDSSLLNVWFKERLPLAWNM